MSKRKNASPRGTALKPRSKKTVARPGNPLGLQTSQELDASEAPTQRQMEIYSFIRDKIHSRGYGPTVREIGQAFKIRSPNGVVCHLKALERKGLISRGKNMSRAIELVTEPAHLRGLPLAGWVAAGTLRPAEELGISLKTLYNKLHQMQDVALQDAAARPA